MESEGLKFKVILSYIDTFEASLRLMRPHLKKQIKKRKSKYTLQFFLFI